MYREVDSGLFGDPQQGIRLFQPLQPVFRKVHIQLDEAKAQAAAKRGIVFERGGRRVVALWHMTGECCVKIDLGKGAKDVAVGDRRYFETSLSIDEVERAFRAATRSPAAKAL